MNGIQFKICHYLLNAWSWWWKQHQQQQKQSTGVQNQFLRFYFRLTTTPMIFTAKQSKLTIWAALAKGQKMWIVLTSSNTNNNNDDHVYFAFLLHFNQANALHWNVILCTPLIEWERAHRSGIRMHAEKSFKSIIHVHTYKAHTYADDDDDSSESWVSSVATATATAATIHSFSFETFKLNACKCIF